jgi:hypothetical protein
MIEDKAKVKVLDEIVYGRIELTDCSDALKANNDVVVTALVAVKSKSFKVCEHRV